MLDKKRGYAYYRPFYAVDPNVNIQAGMVAFLATSGGATVATTAASGTVPIGTFWKDRSNGYIRAAVETKTFDASNQIFTSKPSIVWTAAGKVTNATGTVVYVEAVDFTVNVVNGILTRLPAGSIPALGTVVVWYRYNVTATQVYWDNVATKYTSGYNYDRQPDDTLGSGKITVAEGDAKIYTDQYDPTMTYTLNHWVRPDANSLWTTNVTAYSICGRIIKVPTAGDPFLGIQQIMVAV
jgi:hypothetical protein